MNHDVLIIGAGPVGLCLAKALADQSLKVALVERQPEQALAEPAFDGREIALTHASMRLMHQLDLWRHIPEEGIAPLRNAQVMNGASPHHMRIDGELAGQEQLGCLVPNHLIRRAAWLAVRDTPGIIVHAEAKVSAVHADAQQAWAELQDGSRLQAGLLVAADSRFSETRRALGIDADMHDFGKSMLVCRMRHSVEHKHTAWEWFDHGQTLALLPLQEYQSSVVVTVTGEQAQRLVQMEEAEFGREMERRFDNRLGSMQLESTRHAYPLVGVYSRRFVGPRFALAGDAAVGMHPVTAHGFNFGLAGVERLASAMRQGKRRGLEPADPRVLSRYQRNHRLGTKPLYLTTRAIVGLYTDDRKPARVLREAALRAGSRLSPFRRAVAASLANEGPQNLSPLQHLRSRLAALRP